MHEEVGLEPYWLEGQVDVDDEEWRRSLMLRHAPGFGPKFWWLRQLYMLRYVLHPLLERPQVHSYQPACTRAELSVPGLAVLRCTVMCAEGL